ncbi:MAG: FAD-binding protein [Clostridia bacterium]|nr:FAD-binding protein [Clostridia bacterium]
MENINFYYELKNNYNLQNKHLFKKHTGNAKYYYQLIFGENLENDLNELHKLYNSKTPFKIFGLHTNLYITDNGYDGIFIDVNLKNKNIYFNKDLKTFTVSSNVTVSELVKYTMELGYDFAALTGIPGLIGAGITGNAGWTPTRKCFSDFVQEITLYDFKEGKNIKIIPDKNFFDIRNSFIKQQNKEKTRYFVKEAILKSDYIGKNLVKEKHDAQLQKREKSLYFGYKDGTAGSLWSTPHLKRIIGMSFNSMLKENPSINANFNGATYSQNGSHFFTTDFNTTDKDVAKLFIHTINKVKEIYNVELHKEILILDNDGEIDLETFIKRNS